MLSSIYSNLPWLLIGTPAMEKQNLSFVFHYYLHPGTDVAIAEYNLMRGCLTQMSHHLWPPHTTSSTLSRALPPLWHTHWVANNATQPNSGVAHVAAEESAVHNSVEVWIPCQLSQLPGLHNWKQQVKTIDEKIQAVAEWTKPTNLKQLQCFLGFANLYHCFIRD